ncbi:hypothetical protein [Shimazuella alba]|uniref:Uncharacterized protein n=1 Tax=Shimazuella alba TaxID=2690964 RepID=A0A6I4VUA2_9BACL|nr:hypothetical protein [Shimazuella alba]MXQ54108.1 hypothetical protein [Shimazuella alba]
MAKKNDVQNGDQMQETDLAKSERLIEEARVLIDSVFKRVRKGRTLTTDEFKALCQAILKMNEAYPLVKIPIRQQKLGLSIRYLEEVIERLIADDKYVSIDTQLTYAHAQSGYPN